ncbi:hypothetical protein DSECCO2_477100 [anaerobic digester metagenome]
MDDGIGEIKKFGAYGEIPYFITKTVGAKQPGIPTAKIIADIAIVTTSVTQTYHTSIVSVACSPSLIKTCSTIHFVPDNVTATIYLKKPKIYITVRIWII